jgi:hypothetical protein
VTCSQAVEKLRSKGYELMEARTNRVYGHVEVIGRKMRWRWLRRWPFLDRCYHYMLIVPDEGDRL